MAANGITNGVKCNGTDVSNYPRKQSMTANGIEVKGTFPKKRQEVLRWDGWGYKDTRFYVKGNIVHYKGQRYPIDDGELPLLTEEIRRLFDIDITETPPRPLPTKNEVPASIIPKYIIEEIENLGISCSDDHIDRLFRSHGQTVHEIAKVISKTIERICDLVVWPTCHEDVEKIVELAKKNELVIIPVGGCTSVSQALVHPPEEKRPIIALDTTQMNSILWIDENSMSVCCESGIVGQDLERELKKQGFTIGHEPDSYEFSTVGGWVATRASGMKKNTYGNIEDLLIHARMVTTEGVLEKGCRVPRMSCGPDLDHVMMGSEGCFGVVTEVILKIRPVPKFTRYGSVVFPNFESGVNCLREVARQRIQPSSIRLLDKDQRKFGQSMKANPGYLEHIMDNLKRIYISHFKGMDYEELCLATMLFEGDDENQLIDHQNQINDIALDCGGYPSGATNGKKGYLLTFVIAYLRDLAYELGVVGESFETSVSWDKAVSLYQNVIHAVKMECEKLKVPQYNIAHRLTQTYDTGCCFYFYMGIAKGGVNDPLKIYDLIEEKARDVIIASGGSISHHHGVGKLRKKWYKDTISTPGVNVMKATKSALDPSNVFAAGNLI